MKEITPSHLRCGFGTCPGVFEVDGDNLLIVGKKIPENLQKKISSRVADDEYAIIIRRDFFDELLKK